MSVSRFQTAESGLDLPAAPFRLRNFDRWPRSGREVSSMRTMSFRAIPVPRASDLPSRSPGQCKRRSRTSRRRAD